MVIEKYSILVDESLSFHVYAYFKQWFLFFFFRMMKADGSFNIAADTAMMISEFLKWIIVMLKYPIAWRLEITGHSLTVSFEQLKYHFFSV